jgi:hypothetical protein
MATHDQRYGADHRRRRRALAPAVEAGLTSCARCGKPILPGERWDLGHVDGTNDYSGPEHARCNRATVTHAREASETWSSRDW